MSRPQLLKAEDLTEGENGEFRFKQQPDLEETEEGRAVEWKKPSPACWLQAPTALRLHSGKFSLDFSVESPVAGQIGAGFLLDWNVGPDWGFFGYLGSSTSSWSYDPSTGDVVYNTRSIRGGLPKFSEHSGVIRIEFLLPRNAAGVATFIVDGEKTPSIDLPDGAVVVPAACLLKKGQKVTLKNFVHETLSTACLT